MKKPNITEGKWEIKDVTDYQFWISCNGSEICDVYGEENAHAISAVPEMIDALIEAKGTLEYIKSFQTGHVCNSDIEQIESALKKAGVQL